MFSLGGVTGSAKNWEDGTGFRQQPRLSSSSGSRDSEKIPQSR